MNEKILIRSRLFYGFDEGEVHSVLECLKASVKTFEKGQYIFRQGDTTDALCVIVKGTVQVLSEDYWGERQIMGIFGEGELFGESYACVEQIPLMVSAVALEQVQVLFLKVKDVLCTCSSACVFHRRLIQNFTAILAGKNLMLTRKINHISKKSIRGKVLAYLSSEAGQKGSSCVELAFNRQQLADYLAVDRSALSAELSRMQKDGLITFRKNSFTLHRTQEE